MLQQISSYHLVGIGGSGMSAIAKVLLEMGCEVSGSDLHQSDMTDKLTKMGARVCIGHRAENVNGAQALVVSTAIHEDNPELGAARRKKIPVLHRSEVLAGLMNNRKGIAVAGAHGKTTTTSMIALVLEKCGLDPTVVIGGELANIGGNAKLGSGPYLVAEADESDGSFLRLSPKMAVVTNIEDDHLDHYGTKENIILAFNEFLHKLPQDGLAVLCFDNDTIRELAPGLSSQVITYALNHAADYTADHIEIHGSISTYDVYFRGHKLGRAQLPVPGKHNILNSLATIAIACAQGLSFEQVVAALKEFQGAKRRFTTKGLINGVWVVDDYAHHPTEIAATIEAAKQTAPKRLIVAFQPHRYTRTKLLKNEFAQAFTHADVVILTDIYSAGENAIEGVSGENLQQVIEQHDHRQVTYIPRREDIADYLAEFVQPGDLIITMGAGSIWMTGEELVQKLQQKTV